MYVPLSLLTLLFNPVSSAGVGDSDSAVDTNVPVDINLDEYVTSGPRHEALNQLWDDMREQHPEIIHRLPAVLKTGDDIFQKKPQYSIIVDVPKTADGDSPAILAHEVVWLDGYKIKVSEIDETWIKAYTEKYGDTVRIEGREVKVKDIDEAWIEAYKDRVGRDKIASVVAPLPQVGADKSQGVRMMGMNTAECGKPYRLHPMLRCNDDRESMNYAYRKQDFSHEEAGAFEAYLYTEMALMGFDFSNDISPASQQFMDIYGRSSNENENWEKLGGFLTPEIVDDLKDNPTGEVLVDIYGVDGYNRPLALVWLKDDEGEFTILHNLNLVKEGLAHTYLLGDSTGLGALFLANQYLAQKVAAESPMFSLWDDDPRFANEAITFTSAHGNWDKFHDRNNDKEILPEDEYMRMFALKDPTNIRGWVVVNGDRKMQIKEDVILIPGFGMKLCPYGMETNLNPLNPGGAIYNLGYNQPMISTKLPVALYKPGAQPNEYELVFSLNKTNEAEDARQPLQTITIQPNQFTLGS